METTTLYRPVGPAELDLIKASAWRRFPPRLPEQPIFYPVLNEEYATEITQKWNVQQYGIGYVVRFRMQSDYLEKFPVQIVGDKIHEELWIPAEEMDDFNARIVGTVEMIAKFSSNTPQLQTNPFSHTRFIGGFFGLIIGDAAGAPYEGLPADMIYKIGPARKLVEQPQQKKLIYTDDTQMMIGVTKTLLEKGEIDPTFLVHEFADRYDPDRGYGQGMRTLLEKIAEGVNPETATTAVFPMGSYGNGAAMRVAPIGLYFAEDLNRVAEEAAKSARTTHVHPLGVDGAVLLAIAVALAFRCENGKIKRAEFVDELLQFAETEEFQWQLKTLRNTDRDTMVSFGNGLEAHRSVTTAIRVFIEEPDDYVAVISSAIGCGNDVDTIAAMAGSLSGAYLGFDAIPQNLLVRLESDHEEGRSFLENLAEELWKKAPFCSNA